MSDERHHDIDITIPSRLGYGMSFTTLEVGLSLNMKHAILTWVWLAQLVGCPRSSSAWSVGQNLVRAHPGATTRDWATTHPSTSSANVAAVDLNDRRRLLFGGLATATASAAPPPGRALTPAAAGADYDAYAAGYDALDGGPAAALLGLPAARAALLLRAARGRVLEVGVGTGLNLPCYEAVADRLASLTLVDVSANMLRAAEERLARGDLPRLQRVPVRFVQADATSELVATFGSGAFDTVVDTFSLCVMGAAGARECLRQLVGVTEPREGRVLLLENSRSDNRLLGLYQDATADAAAAVAGKGCVYNQDVAGMLREAAPDLEVLRSDSYAAGLFRSFECRRRI